jgi:transcriptional regulator with PAS, ATPase and Fis domain
VHDSWRGVHDSWGGIEPPDVRYAIPILGQSPKMQRILRFISKVAPTESTVLITGESGTGKELAARAIHLQSPRASQEFVPINCGALPEALLESELFGHVKGAFTGALSDKAGLFEVADSGTLFLDEVAEMPPSSQVKLLRALEERRVRRVGGRDLIPVNVRIITATNRNLRDALASGEFRKDLYYRLNVFQIDLPPLRDRREDIPLLAMYFLQRYGDSLTLREVERLHIQRVLTKHGWSLSKTARSLGISRSTLWRKISSYGIKKPKEMQ